MRNERSPLEDDLRQALSRVEAPASFADGVLRRLKSEPVQTSQPGAIRNPVSASGLRHLARFAALRFSSALAASLLLLLLQLGSFLSQRHRRQQAQAAAQQFTLAMRLTNAALLDAEQQIAEHSTLATPHHQDHRPTTRGNQP